MSGEKESTNEDLYKVFGRDTAAGKALYGLYNPHEKPKVTPVVIKPKKQPTPEEIAEAERQAALAKQKPVVNVPKFYKKVERPPEPHIPSRKMYEQIMVDNPPERDDYVPAPPKYDAEKEKERLAGLMENRGQPSAPKPKPKPQPIDDEEEDVDIALFKQLGREIKERQEFLEKMTALGQGAKYERDIKAEIAFRTQQMEKLKLKIDQKKK
eukprot:TRINITY_DN10298_c0_g1_i1.p2 TRINITY_DN10298_c0_g1~~TRINITY_DN10298_c0_g1_i1.p2  ORF type:complete len:211 (+),score=60.59 TRINITY_DN10298_c0_g1_i1:552-1184(+)